MRIEVGGHTDSSGSAALNLELSQQRAQTVRQQLVVRYGIDADRVEIRGYGSSRPVESNATEEGQQKNRRVEFTIITMGEPQVTR